jgi:uncharacterized protein YaeQ
VSSAARRGSNQTSLYGLGLPCPRKSLALLIGLLTITGWAQQKWPGTVNTIKSPSGAYTLINSDHDTEPHHTLLLQNNKNGEETTIYSYSRNVRVFWSPQSDRLAITDNYASNESRIILFSMEGRVTEKDLTVQSLATLAADSDRLSFTNNDHVYPEVLSWERDGALRIKIWGYGLQDPRGFSRTYRYQKNDSLKRGH